ncbi:MAG: nickel-dependent hydrogenase large subunit [Promethearchaeota archaeon]
MLKTVEVCTRVEGHGNINILFQDDNVSNVDFEISAYRGFEKFLIGKRLLDMPKLISRICGLCYASQAITSCKAIENLYDVEISDQSILLRRLLLCGELIKSHCMHFFFQSLPDLLTIFNINQKPISQYDLINFNPQLTTSLFELIKFGNEIEFLFGGRSAHLISPVPGGVIYSPSRKNITIAQKYMQKASINLEMIIESFIEYFSNSIPPDEYSLPNPIYIGINNLGIYDRYSGIFKITESERKAIEFQEKSYSLYFDKDTDLRGIDFHFNKKKNVLTGPLARFKIIETYGNDKVSSYLENFDKSWINNILFSEFLKLLEMLVETEQALKILDNPSLSIKQKFPILSSIKNPEGIGFVEAPRGILMHHYYVDNNGLIIKLKLFIATEINIPLINEMITKYAQKLYEKTGDITLVKKQIQTIIRAFDPCISCATH